MSMRREGPAPGPLPSAAAGSARPVRELFRGAGYDTAGLQRLLGVSGERLVAGRDVLVHERRLAGDESPLAQLVRLFLLDLAVTPEAAERALGDGLGELAALELVEESGGAVRATVRIVPHESLLVVSDAPRLGAGPDHVAAVHRPSLTLASFTIRRPARRALDVGTGNGVQALLLAAHAERVVATDVNERALAFAELNARLNGIENVELRLGSFLEPVEGERFDVVAANPPYVISPESEYVFRDSGLGRDRVSESLVRALPAVLEEGGFGTVLISWIVDGDEPAAAPQAWTDGNGCATWLFHTALEDALLAASSWNRDAPSRKALRERLDRWLAYYAAERIESIGYGALVLRRGGDWFRALELPEGSRPGPAYLERVFAAVDRLETADDEALAALEARPAPDVLLEHVNRSTGSGWATVSASLTLEQASRFRASLDGHAAAVVAALGSSGPIGAAVAEAASVRGVALEEFAPTAFLLVRRLLELGYLELA